MAAKLKVLCLHGYLQNAEIFRSRMGSWRKGLKSRVEFVFIDAPHVVFDADDSTANSAGGRVGGRSWWWWQDREETPRPSKSAQYTQWEPSMDTITQALKEHGPVDGFIGFSQGATAIALYLACVKLQELDVPLPDFAILVGGFLPRDPAFAELIVKGAPNMSSLHMFGENDQLVDPQRSQHLMANFSNSLRVGFAHQGAHMMPTCSGDVKKQVVSFLDLLNAPSREQETNLETV